MVTILRFSMVRQVGSRNPLQLRLFPVLAAARSKFGRRQGGMQSLSIPSAAQAGRERMRPLGLGRRLMITPSWFSEG